MCVGDAGAGGDVAGDAGGYAWVIVLSDSTPGWFLLLLVLNSVLLMFLLRRTRARREGGRGGEGRGVGWWRLLGGTHALRVHYHAMCGYARHAYRCHAMGCSVELGIATSCHAVSFRAALYHAILCMEYQFSGCDPLRLPTSSREGLYAMVMGDRDG